MDTSKNLSEDAIDVSRIDLAQLSVKAFPVRQPFRIFISEQAHTDVWQHARGTLIEGAEIKEVGGVLIGEVYKDEQGPFLDVKAAIVAEHTRNEGTEVAFTPETWAQVNHVKDERYPDYHIVGWYHTHPRFGIFLSDRDQFIQRHSFSQPWAIAFVVDPVQKTEGFFHWSENEPKEADEYWVGQGLRQRKPKEDATHAEDDASEAKVETKAAVTQLSAAFSTAVGLLALLFAIGYVYWQGYQRYERDKVLLRGLESQSADLDRTMQTLALLKRVAAQPPQPAPAPAPQRGRSGAPAPPATAPVTPPAPLPDPEARNLLQNLENGLQRIGAHIVLLAAQITGQEIKLETGQPGGNSANPLGATPNPEANKP